MRLYRRHGNISVMSRLMAPSAPELLYSSEQSEYQTGYPRGETMSVGEAMLAIGFVGLGRMGGPMSRRLIDAGYSLFVFDTNAEATSAVKRPGRRRRLRLRTSATTSISRSSACRRPTSSNASCSRASGAASASRPSLICRPAGREWRAACRAASNRADRLDRRAGVGRHRGRQERHARRHGFGPSRRHRQRGAAAQELRKGVLCRREGGSRASRQARQQPARRRGHGDLFGSAGDGGQSGHRPQGNARHHQRRKRSQQRHSGQIPALRADPHFRFRLRHRPLLQGRSALRRRGGKYGSSHGAGRRRAADARGHQRKIRRLPPTSPRSPASSRSGRASRSRADRVAAASIFR